MYTKSSSSLQRGRKIQSTKSQNVFSSHFRNFMNSEKSLPGKQIKFHIQGQSFSELPQCLITWMLIHIAVPKVTMIFGTHIPHCLITNIIVKINYLHSCERRDVKLFLFQCSMFTLNVHTKCSHQMFTLNVHHL